MYIIFWHIRQIKVDHLWQLIDIDAARGDIGGHQNPERAGAEAVQQGLFSRAIPKDELLEFTREKVAKAAQGATGAFLASRELVAQIRDQRIGLWESMEQENIAQGKLCSTADYAEGFAAFQEKRKPQFSGELLAK